MNQFQVTNQKTGAALVITVLVVGVLAVIFQSMLFLANSRARLIGQVEDIYAAEFAAIDGLECGLSQAIFQQALAGGVPNDCKGEEVVLQESDFEDYDVEFVVAGAGASCAEVYIRQNKTDDYTVRSVGALVCDENGSIANSFGQRRVVKLMKVTQTDEGQVSRTLIPN